MHAAVPMLHVPNVAATAEWYRGIGFDVIQLVGECEGEDPTFALLGCGESRVMLSAGGQPSDAWRREVDLYVRVGDVAATRATLGAEIDIVEDVHDTFYGAREVIIRDCNRFWITFGQRIA